MRSGFVSSLRCESSLSADFFGSKKAFSASRNFGRVSALPKALLILIGLYLFSPIDVVPDFIPVIGAVDDVAVGLGGLWLFVQLCPPPVVREHVWRIAAESPARG